MHQFVLLYFGAHWAPPSRLFTDTLRQFYLQHKHKLQVVFVSIDGNQQAFERNYADMPWLAIPFTDEPLIVRLRQKFGII